MGEPKVLSCDICHNPVVLCFNIHVYEWIDNTDLPQIHRGICYFRRSGISRNVFQHFLLDNFVTCKPYFLIYDLPIKNEVHCRDRPCSVIVPSAVCSVHSVGPISRIVPLDSIVEIKGPHITVWIPFLIINTNRYYVEHPTWMEGVVKLSYFRHCFLARTTPRGHEVQHH